MNSVPQKTCTKCKTPQPLTDFCKDAQKRDGLHPHCKTCRMAQVQKRKQQKPEQFYELSKARSARHNARWRAKRNAQNRTAYHQDIEKSRARGRKASREVAARYPDRTRAALHRALAKARQDESSFTEQEWYDLKARYNFRCLSCGKQEPDISLTVDHVVPTSQDGPNSIANIQPLCMPCNRRKGNKTIDYRE